MGTVAINGLGRIGRAALKILLDADGLDLVAVNDIADADNLAYLIRYDTVYGRYHRDVTVAAGALVIDGRRIPVFAERDPANLKWDELGVDLVLECTGMFRTEDDLAKHVQAGASYVILSAPTSSETVPTVVHGVNDPQGNPRIISCASCTTNCIAPVIEVAHRRLGVERAVMTTVHAYTAGQQLVDGPSRNFRRGRAGAANLVPTSTGAARATTRAVRARRALRRDRGSCAHPGGFRSRHRLRLQPANHDRRGQRDLPPGDRDRPLRRHPRRLGKSAGVRRHYRRRTRRRHRPRAHHGRRRHARQGDGLVRQRVGLHPPDDPEARAPSACPTPHDTARAPARPALKARRSQIDIHSSPRARTITAANRPHRDHDAASVRPVVRATLWGHDPHRTVPTLRDPEPARLHLQQRRRRSATESPVARSQRLHGLEPRVR